MLLLPKLTVRIWFSQTPDVFLKQLPNAFKSLMRGECVGVFRAMGDLSVPGTWGLKTLWVLWGPSKGRGKGGFLFPWRNPPEWNAYFKDFGRTLGRDHRQPELATVKSNRKEDLVSHCKARTMFLYSFPSIPRLGFFFFFGQDFFRGLNWVIPWSNTHSSIWSQTLTGNKCMLLGKSRAKYITSQVLGLFLDAMTSLFFSFR